MADFTDDVLGEAEELADEMRARRSAKEAEARLRDAGTPERCWRSHSYLTAVDIIRQNAKDVLDGRKLEFNEMSLRVELGRVPMTDVDLSRLRANIEARFSTGVDKAGREVGLQLSRDDVFGAVELVSVEHQYQPVREYLMSLTWDGTERLAAFVEDVLGAERTALNMAIMIRWFISAVARAMRPGCKVDTVVVLIGRKGALKSSLFKALASPKWFSDSPLDVSDPHAPQKMRQGWIIEWQELEALRRAQAETAVRQFLTISEDDYMGKWQKFAVKLPRMCVIVGTSNPKEFLPDIERRFQPLMVGHSINLRLAEDQRDQLWAEAMTRFLAGEQWHLTDEESEQLEQAQGSHLIVDAWEDMILPWCESRLVPVTTADILQTCLQKPMGQWSKADEMRVAKVMDAAGYEKTRRMVGGVAQPREWVKRPIRVQTIPTSARVGLE